MWRNRKSRRPDAEGVLRAYRSQPRDEFVEELGGRIGRAPEAGRRPTAWSRLAFASAASTFIIGMFAAVGGFAYAASGAVSSYSAVKQVVVNHELKVKVHKSSAAAQYPGQPGPPPKAEPPANGTAGQNTGVAGVATARTLPFTGISLLGTVILGTSLLVGGLLLRRRERRDS